MTLSPTQAKETVSLAGEFVVLDKLKRLLEARFTLPTVVEPANAMSRRELRVMAQDIEVNRIPAPAGADYVPYEGVMKAIISMRVSGANAHRYLSAQAMHYTLALEQALMHDVFIIHNVAQALDDRTPGNDALHRTEIVGDAEIIEVRRDESQSGWSGAQEDDDYESNESLFVYRKDYHVRIGLTLHRHFYNPSITQMTFINRINGDTIEVSDEHERP